MVLCLLDIEENLISVVIGLHVQALCLCNDFFCATLCNSIKSYSLVLCVPLCKFQFQLHTVAAYDSGKWFVLNCVISENIKNGIIASISIGK